MTAFWLEERYNEEINKALSTSVSAVADVEKALNTLSVPFCVASSGSHVKMRTTLGTSQLLHYFEDKLYSCSDVDRGKPFPDVYLYAAASMGVSDPSTCLVIEDSLLGIQGGVSAGMSVFGYTELMGREKLCKAGAHHTFNDMGNLASEIARFEQMAI